MVVALRYKIFVKSPAVYCKIYVQYVVYYANPTCGRIFGGYLELPFRVAFITTLNGKLLLTDWSIQKISNVVTYQYNVVFTLFHGSV